MPVQKSQTADCWPEGSVSPPCWRAMLAIWIETRISASSSV
jgi:hypothetical protein